MQIAAASITMLVFGQPKAGGVRVAIISKANIVGIYQPKLEAIARAGVELLALVPPSWRDERGEQPLERAYTAGYTLETLPIVRNGDFHLYHYRGLGERLRAFQPDIVHIDEEAYNLAAWQSLYHARQVGARSLFFTWQNIDRRYPPPFAWGETWVMRHVDHAIAGTDGAAAVLRAKGYRGALSVIPQFGTAPDLFRPEVDTVNLVRPFTIGCVARLVSEKGIDVLLRAVAQLRGEWRVRIIGGGAERTALETLARSLGIADRVTFADQIPSLVMPGEVRGFDVLAVPSLTRPNWKEQFGPRAAVEAMMSGVAVVGSDSGAIPDVVGDGGVIVPEGDAAALAAALQRLLDDPAYRRGAANRGRARALAHYTHEQIAAATVGVYRAILGVE